MDITKGNKIYQEKTGHAALNQGAGQTIYLDSTNGNNGNSGLDPRHPVATLAQAESLCEAGDTIMIAPGGGETVTSTVTFNVANVKVICPSGLLNPANGYRVAGAGTLDLITVAADGVHIAGLQLAHTGATASASGILLNTGQDNVVIESCYFDDVAVTTTFTGAGVEVTAGCDDVLIKNCVFLDNQFGVYFKDSSTLGTDRPRVEGCTFYVGQSEAYGVYGKDGSGVIQGLVIDDCKFIEADGDGSAATAAWDGASATDGAQGPIELEGDTDQYLISNCVASTALSVIFA